MVLFTPLLYQLFSLHWCSLASQATSEANSTSLCQKLVASGVGLVSFREDCCQECLCHIFFYMKRSLLRWRRSIRLECGSLDPGLIPGVPSLCVGPLMVRRLKTS